MVGKLKVCIIGSEGWGSAIAASVSNNVKQLEGFDSRAHIYVYDELVRSKYLSEVMNNCHENIKYLPGIRLPENLIAVNDLLAAAQNADILIFATPQHFVKSYCNILAGKVKENAIALSMVKGLAHVSDGEIDLYSNLISQQLDIPCYSLMSANSAMEMAQGKLCELTIGCNDGDDARLLTEVLQTDNCRVITVDDVDGVELCGTLKDIIALGAGFVDGLKLGENARVAALHLGVKEMMRFTMTFYPNAKISTFFESCAVANSVASTYVDKNVTFATSFITSGKTIQEIESNLLNGRKLLGPLVAAELNTFLEEEDMQDEFPLFTAIHRICQNEVDPETILETLRTHPDLSSSLSFSQFLSDESTTEDSLEKILEPSPEPISALDKALAEAGKNKSFRELNENGSWHLVYDVNKAKKQTSIDPWQVNERKGLQISGWLESNDSNEPKNASGTHGSGENESVVGSTSGSDDCQGIGCTENAEKTEKLPVDKTWLRDQPPPMIIGSDDKSNTETPFKDSNMAKVDAAETKESVENHPRPLINKFQALNIKPKTGKQSKTDQETAASRAKDGKQKSEVLPKKLTMPTFSYTQEIRQQIEALTSKSKENATPESEKNVNATEEAGERSKTDGVKATKAEFSKAQQEKPKSETISSTPEDKIQMPEDPVKMEVPKHKESSATGSEHKFVFDSLEDKQRFESILMSKSKKDRLSRIDGSESGKEYTQTWRYMSPPQPLQNLQVTAEDKQPEQAEDVEMSESTEENKAVPREQQQDSLTEENFEKWKQVEAEERPAKHSQTEENMYLSAEELIRRELEHHQKENHEFAEQAEATRIPKEDEGDGKQDMVPVDEEAPRDADKRELLSEERKHDGQRPAMSGQKKPHQSPDEANLRYFSFDKKDGKGHEWDWLHNKETPETKGKPVDERLSEYYVNEKSDQQKLEKLNKQLQEVFKKHTEEADLGIEASGNSVESHESSEAKPLALDPVTAQKKRDAQQPQTPVPGPKQTPAKAPPPMPKRQKIAEGSPQFQAAPRTIPPPSPQTLPLTPQEQQPHRKHLPIQSDALEQPPASHQADESAKAARGQKEIIDTPAATREAQSPSDQQATNKAEAPAFEVKKLMTHFLKRENPETNKMVETPPKEVKNQRESAYELVNDPRTATKEHKSLPEDNTPPIEKPSAQASPKEQKQLKAGEMTNKLRSMLRRDQEKKVGYKGKNPFLKEPDLQSHPPMDTSLEHDLARRRSTGQQLRRTVVVKPPFNPPLNPRVRIPRPPFDGRDREYHTLAMPAIWLNLKQTQTQTTMRANIQVKQLSMAVHSPPKLQLPLGLLPRCSALNKLLCAVQIGLLATFLARCRNRNK